VAAPDRQRSLERLRATARDLVALTAGVPDDRLQRSPAPGEWSPATVVEHLADAELVYSVRLRMVLTGDRPYLAGYDEAAWAERFAGLDGDTRGALARWRMLREANLRLFDSLEDEEWQCAGLHADLGEVTVAHVAALLADHDRDHLDQLRRGTA
jgi:hypothetical protein